MSNLEAVKVMLDNAGIRYQTEAVDAEYASGCYQNVAQGSTVLHIDNLDQRHAGGYPVFFTEVVFDPEGNLFAIWGWE